MVFSWGLLLLAFLFACQVWLVSLDSKRLWQESIKVGIENADEVMAAQTPVCLLALTDKRKGIRRFWWRHYFRGLPRWRTFFLLLAITGWSWCAVATTYLFTERLAGYEDGVKVDGKTEESED